MALDLDSIGEAIGPLEKRYDWKDLALYALGVGAGFHDLDYCFEARLKAVPSWGIAAIFDFLARVALRSGANLAGILHGEHELLVHRTIPTEAVLRTTGRITRIADKGAGKGAVVVAELDGTARCPSEAEFRDLVAARVGYVPFVEEADLEVSVRIFSARSGLTGLVTMGRHGAEPMTRAFDGGPSECAALAEAMALAIALRMDPIAFEAPPDRSPADQGPSGAVEAPPAIALPRAPEPLEESPSAVGARSEASPSVPMGGSAFVFLAAHLCMPNGALTCDDAMVDLLPSVGGFIGFRWRFLRYLAAEAALYSGTYSPRNVLDAEGRDYFGETEVTVWTIGVLAGPRVLVPVGPVDLTSALTIGWGQESHEERPEKVEDLLQVSDGFVLGYDLGAEWRVARHFAVGAALRFVFPFFTRRCTRFDGGQTDCESIGGRGDPAAAVLELFAGVHATFYFAP